MIRFVVIDLEFTHRELADAHVIEWATVVIEPEWFGNGGIVGTYSGLVRPPISIPPETSAVHHIIDADVADAPSWEVAQHAIIDIFQDDPEVVAVAHSAEAERTMLAALNLKCRWLCTYKAALRIWPDAPSHSNEGLRYWLGHGTGRSVPQAPHSAAHDAQVTSKIFNELMAAGANFEDMIRWTDEPALLPRCPLGDWRGRRWSEVDDGFLDWIMRKIYDREDVRFCAKREIERRHEEYRKAQQAHAAAATATAGGDEDDDIPF